MSVVDPHSQVGVADLGGTVAGCANVVALDEVLRGAVPPHPNLFAPVCGYDVALRRGSATDDVVSNIVDVYPLSGVTQVNVAGHVKAYEVALDYVPALAGEFNAVAAEAVDGEAAHGATAAEDPQPISPRPDGLPAQLDDGAARITRLCGPVDGHRVGDVRQTAQRGDSLRTTGRDIEPDTLQTRGSIR